MVVGVPNEEGSDLELCACVTLDSKDDVTTDHVREMVEQDIVVSEDEPLSPRPLHFLAFDSFPVTSTGKPLRREVSEKARQRLSSSDK